MHTQQQQACIDTRLRTHKSSSRAAVQQTETLSASNCSKNSSRRRVECRFSFRYCSVWLFVFVCLFVVCWVEVVCAAAAACDAVLSSRLLTNKKNRVRRALASHASSERGIDWCGAGVFQHTTRTRARSARCGTSFRVVFCCRALTPLHVFFLSTLRCRPLAGRGALKRLRLAALRHSCAR